MNKMFAVALLLILSPIFIIVSLLILIIDGKPILYQSLKYGKNEKKFILFKFRTMKINTPKKPTQEMSNASLYTSKLGSFLRKTSIDELPQLVNIILGNMNFIGPRPGLTENEDQLHHLGKEYNVYTVMPGVTGWAQINGRDNNSYEKKAMLDKYYVENKSFILDLKILFKTFIIILDQKLVKH